MPLNALAQEVLSIPQIPDRGAVAYVLGDPAVSFVPAIGAIGTLTVTLSRHPAGSGASISSNTLTPDVAGLYTVTVTNCNQTRTVSIYAFPSSGPAAPLLQKVNSFNALSPFVTRGMLLQLVNDNFNFAPLEQSPPTLVGTSYSATTGPNWAQYNSRDNG